MLFGKSIVLALATVIAACGSSPKAARTDAPAVGQSTAAKEMPAATKDSLPAAGIIRVPLDANGAEQLDKADFRTASTVKASDGQSVSAAFDNGATPSNVSELDKDTSTQSWGHWGGYSNYGYNSYYYGSYSNSYYYNYWRPSYNYYGYNYGYSNPSFYCYGNYNYYYYPRGY